MCSGYLLHSSLKKEKAIIVVVVTITTRRPIITIILWGLYRISLSFIHRPSCAIFFLLLLLLDFLYLGSVTVPQFIECSTWCHICINYTTVQEVYINHSKAGAHLGTQEVWIRQLSYGRVFSPDKTFTQESDSKNPFNSFPAPYAEKDTFK